VAAAWPVATLGQQSKKIPRLCFLTFDPVTAQTNRFEPFRSLVNAGGLMAYNASTSTFEAHTATYVDKILKGVKPSDLPVEQPTKFELIINMKAAKAIDLQIPDKLLALADELIE
jgi:ABC-type uncharacterized transport system substrate-binding protein